MPPKQCAKCTKTVYPTEELKCLDKVWHKGCFKCNSCNMTLNMKNYKGYNKLPYCSAHYPTTKFTSVADTPENRRIAANTQIQSNIKYHEEFEREKGKVTVVADDPEVLRVKKNMNIISNVSYHGEKDKKQEMERIRPAEQVEGEKQEEDIAGRHRHNPGRISDYDPTDRPDVAAGDTPYSNRVSAGARQVYDSNVGRVEQPQARQVGSIHDYDPLNENYGSIAGQHNRAQQAPQQQYQPPPQQYQPPPQQYQPPPQQYQPPVQPPQPKAEPKNKYAGKGMVCRALYDYEAADDDEVSFREDDIIIFCQPIDAGWMEGEVEKSGQRGMLPSNYVEKI